MPTRRGDCLDAFDLTPHRVYSRAEIHHRWKGQGQGGIATPRGIPVVFAFSGPSGARFGYDKDEGWRPDGTFEYTGEGQRGPMRMIRGNRAIRDHAEDGKDLHLFVETARKRDRTVEYVGPMTSLGYRLSQAPDDDGVLRETIVFRLAPLEAVVAGAESEDATRDLMNDDLAELMRKALEKATAGEPPEVLLRKGYRRAAAVQRLARRRAAGTCEGCNAPAPFATAHGPFLEVHHLTRVADGGPDHPDHVVAICPNCHRRVHLSTDAPAFAATLRAVRGI
jgi:5-methylcytosine-specific restriction protein A